MALHLNFAKATTMINLRMEYSIVADAILGRIIRNAYPIVLKDESMRKILTNCHTIPNQYSNTNAVRSR